MPGTVAAALLAGEQRLADAGAGLDQRDWWFRTMFSADPLQAGEHVALLLDGLATVVEVYLNGRQMLRSESMFAAHCIDVGAVLRARNQLAICCRALAPLLAGRRRPRARWRTALVADGNLRFYRTMLLGRAPSFAPGPPVIGPWRPIRLARRRPPLIDTVALRTQIEGADGMLSVEVHARTLPGTPPPGVLNVTLRGPAGTQRTPLAPTQHEVVMSTSAWEDLSVPSTPHFVLVDGDTGRIEGRGSAISWEQIVTLVEQAGGDAARHASEPPSPGARDSAGREFAARSSAGRDSVARSSAARAARAQETLAAAGITAGHPSLYPSRGGPGAGEQP